MWLVRAQNNHVQILVKSTPGIQEEEFCPNPETLKDPTLSVQTKTASQRSSHLFHSDSRLQLIYSAKFSPTSKTVDQKRHSAIPACRVLHTQQVSA